MAIGDRIKEERERLKKTQAEFAELAGAAKRSQIGWEQDRSRPNAEVLEAWAHAGADIVYIVTGERLPSDQVKTYALFDAYFIDQAKVEGTPEEIRELKNVAFIELAKRSPTARELLLISNYRQLDDGARKMVFDMAMALQGAKVTSKTSAKT